MKSGASESTAKSARRRMRRPRASSRRKAKGLKLFASKRRRLSTGRDSWTQLDAISKPTRQVSELAA